jgi:nucleoside-diphosphate-sugar epimerase
MSKCVLLIGGAGTLGSYTAEELLKIGYNVDIICLEDMHSEEDRLNYFKAVADKEYLEGFLRNRYYNGIINFIHYISVDTYKPIHQLLSKKTDHLIFLSSYRVYADLEHPITENSPRLLNTTEDKYFLEKETYAVPKSKIEDYLRGESETENWTIVRPVISFSKRRMDLVTRSEREIIDMAKTGEIITLPAEAKDMTAGLDWAGNSGKLIAHLLFKECDFREAYTISTAQNLKWGEVADIYADFLNARFRWISVDDYIKENEKVRKDPFILKYDRLFDRKIDNQKVLMATGLKKDDFVSVRDGIKYELSQIENEF